MISSRLFISHGSWKQAVTSRQTDWIDRLKPRTEPTDGNRPPQPTKLRAGRCRCCRLRRTAGTELPRQRRLDLATSSNWAWFVGGHRLPCRLAAPSGRLRVSRARRLGNCRLRHIGRLRDAALHGADAVESLTAPAVRCRGAVPFAGNRLSANEQGGPTRREPTRPAGFS